MERVMATYPATQNSTPQEPIGVQRGVCPQRLSFRSLLTTAHGHGPHITARKAIRWLARRTTTPYSFLLRAAATVRRSTALESTASIGVLRLTRAIPFTPTTSTSAVAITSWAGAAATTGGQFGLCQNESEAHSIHQFINSSLRGIKTHKIVGPTNRANFFLFPKGSAMFSLIFLKNHLSKLVRLPK